MRIVYDYPEDAQDGDDFVLDEVDVSPTTVTIILKRHRPKPDPRAEQDATALVVADKLLKELSWDSPRLDVIHLLTQAYRAVRPISQER